LGVMGDDVEMGDTRPTDWRLGPVELVAAGDESDVSIGGGDAGCCGLKGDGSGIANGDMGRAMLDGDLRGSPPGDIGPRFDGT
jgi:hypothetical protein